MELCRAVRQGVVSIGKGFEEIGRGFQRLQGGLSDAGIVEADAEENYPQSAADVTGRYQRLRTEVIRGLRNNREKSDDSSQFLEDFIRDFKPGVILTDGTSLSRRGVESVTLISGDSLAADRIREIMITLQLVDTVARDLDGTSPLRAVYELAQSGGRMDSREMNPHAVDVLERYRLGKISSDLGWSDVSPSLPIQVPYRKQSFILDPEVVAVAKSGIMLEGDNELVLRNPERPERDQRLEMLREINDKIARVLGETLSANEVLVGLIEPRLSKTGSDLITLRNWREKALIAREDGGPYEWRQPTDGERAAIDQRCGPLSDRLAADSIRSVALRLEQLIPQAQEFEALYDHVSKGTVLSNDTALLLESHGLGTTFYRGSSGPDTQLGIAFEKGVVEVLLSGACWIPNQDGGFLGLLNPEEAPPSGTHHSVSPTP